MLFVGYGVNVVVVVVILVLFPKLQKSNKQQQNGNTYLWPLSKHLSLIQNFLVFYGLHEL